MELTPYRIMWIFVLFDLPVLTKVQRKDYTTFRKSLEKLGFGMQQFSVYNCFCGSRERMEAQIQRIKNHLPPAGHVMIMNMTDRQYQDIVNFYCRSEAKLKEGPQQLELF